MDEDREEVNKRQRLPRETPATVQDAKTAKNGNVLKIAAQINAFIDAELPYSIIDDVVNVSLFPEVNDEIYSTLSTWNNVNFTPNSKRYMRHVSRNCHPSCNDLLSAIHDIFTDSHIHLKVIYSLPGDVAQLQHTDMLDKYTQTTPQDRRKYHYSIIVAVCKNTKLIFEKVLIDIPVGSMIIFRGDTPHAGAAYKNYNHRFFISIAHPLYPVHKAVNLITDNEV